MSEDEDLEVVKKVVAGDTAAFGIIVERYSSRVARYLWNNFGCHDDVEDALQEVFVTVLESLHTFRGEAKFSTWLYSVTANYCRNRHKKDKRFKSVSLHIEREDGEFAIQLVDERVDIAARVELDDSLRIVHEELEKLPSDYREILVLRDIEGLPYDEIATALDISLANVKVRIHRARELLRRRLVERGLV